ncbi:uncharacterized protein F5891DRAFT_1190304 [Suillus fuscotomentosus]|uniref:Uncharacterized protein n=1 Tax=Suillus fuscotomentosus TaxID=1912939 RepID=A0AAD4E326_9AGAM|nr:uncharacterized protein F5891DRAFT_1190304 [Suillus fuscotomentosus]KAG1898823.1 hypothetical protein F5891DRAFT_1190304 [Suillus fuscotomentosus]
MSNQKALLLVCNFESTAITLIANFLAASKDDKNEDDNSNAYFELTLAADLLNEWVFLYKDLDVRDPDQIYWSEFILEMIKSAHINTISRFLDVPALNMDDLQLKGMQAVIAACTASLECALNFVAMSKAFGNDQSIGTGSAKGSTTKSHKIPLKRNKFSGKDSAATSAFSEANCGLATTEYYESLKREGMKYTMDTIAFMVFRVGSETL